MDWDKPYRLMTDYEKAREQYVYDRLDVHRAAEREAEAMGLRVLVNTPLTLVGPRLEDILAAEYDALHTS
jgi:hypothetical protein